MKWNLKDENLKKKKSQKKEILMKKKSQNLKFNLNKIKNLFSHKKKKLRICLTSALIFSIYFLYTAF